MFVVDALPDSSSDSECEIPKFEIPAFKKYGSGIKSEPQKKGNFPDQRIKLSSSLDPGTEIKDNYINFNIENASIKNHLKRQKEILQATLEKNLKKSIVCQPDFPKLEKLPTIKSKNQLRKERARERAKTTGEQWYNMPTPEMTDEKKNDLMVLQMRKALDPKHFYKRSADKINSKYFEVGTFVESPVDFYSSRVPKKQRKQTLVDELMADAEFRQTQKKKFVEIQQSRPTMKKMFKKKLSNRQRAEARSADARGYSKKNNKNTKKKA